MRTLKFFGFFIVLIALSSCSKTDDVTQYQEAQDLDELLTEIKELASSVNCEDDEVWKFVDYGSLACGGPVDYIAYSEKIDVERFLEKIAEHKKLQKEYNENWKIASICTVPIKPADVQCDGGKPVFGY